jgi:hypothetical protein
MSETNRVIVTFQQWRKCKEFVVWRIGAMHIMRTRSPETISENWLWYKTYLQEKSLCHWGK